MAESKLIKGAAVLTAAAVISKLLGTLQKIPLQNIAGDEAFGIYSAVYPFYTFILLIATAGIPVAVSKFVAEYIEQGQLLQARRLTLAACLFLTITGIAFFLFLYFGASFISGLIGSEETAFAIRSVSFALLIVPFMAVIRGYFQGKQDMMPTAVSQVIEQIFRVLTMVIFLLILTSAGKSSGIVAAGAVFGSVIGALAGLILMLILWVKEVKHVPAYKISEPKERGFASLTSMMLPLIAYALPVCIGSVVIPMLTLVDTFTLPRLLALQAPNAGDSLREFGVFARGLPLVQLVAMLFSSVAVALVPAISEAHAHGKVQTIRNRTELSLRITWWIGLAATLGLMLTAVPVNQMFYQNDEGSLAIAIISLSICFSAVQIVSTSILQGLGKAKLPAVYLLIAAAVKIGLNLLLVPRFGIEGAAVSLAVTYLVAAILNIRAVVKHTGVVFSPAKYMVKPILPLVLMSGFIMLIVHGGPRVLSLFSLMPRIEQSLIALLSVTAGTVVFLYSALRFGWIEKQEWAMLPQLQQKVHRYMPWLKKGG